MINLYYKGNQIVFGVRKERKTDSFLKRFTAQTYYKMLKLMGVNIIFNHADYRLISKRIVEELKNYEERNLFLRGIFPQLGFKTAIVYYDRSKRELGESKYTLKKMLKLAIDGITSFSVAPLRLISILGIIIFSVSIILFFYYISLKIIKLAVPTWLPWTTQLYFIGGLLLLSLGIIAEYQGKIYLEVKKRPRFIIEKKI